jgi:hypothetical protein
MNIRSPLWSKMKWCIGNTNQQNYCNYLSPCCILYFCTWTFFFFHVQLFIFIFIFIYFIIYCNIYLERECTALMNKYTKRVGNWTVHFPFIILHRQINRLLKKQELRTADCILSFFKIDRQVSLFVFSTKIYLTNLRSMRCDIFFERCHQFLKANINTDQISFY